MIKEAQNSSLVNMFTTYFSTILKNKEDKKEAIFTTLSPDSINSAFKATDMGWYSKITPFLNSYLNVDINKINSTIISEIKQLVESNPNPTEEQIKAVIDRTLNSYNKPISQEDLEKIPEDKINELTALSCFNDSDKRMIKLAFDRRGLISGALGRIKLKIFSILSKALLFLFIGALAAAGIVYLKNKFMPSKDNKPEESLSSKMTGYFQQTITPNVSKFKINSNYRDKTYNSNNDNVWTVNMTNNRSNINSMLVNFTKEVYENMDGRENEISSLQDFQDTANQIASYNFAYQNEPYIFIPRQYKSKKDLVNSFINELPEKT